MKPLIFGLVPGVALFGYLAGKALSPNGTYVHAMSACAVLGVLLGIVAGVFFGIWLERVDAVRRVERVKKPAVTITVDASKFEEAVRNLRDAVNRSTAKSLTRFDEPAPRYREGGAR